MTDRITKIVLRGDISDLQAKLAMAGKSIKSVADQATANTKESKKWRQGLDGVASSAGKMGLVAGAAFTAIVLKAANFDQAMSNVAAATHESEGNMKLLRDAALDAGQRTQFSATQAASAIEALAKAGVSTADILGGGLDGAMDLAAAGSLEVGTAAEIAATALTQFGLAGKDVPHVADLLAAGAGKAQGEVSDLSYALKQSGLVAAQMGISIEDTVGTLSAFASAGLLGSDAGTSFRTMLLRLSNPSKKAASEMSALGISAYDAQGNFVGIESLAGQLQKAFEGQSQATRDAALATIFGSDAIRAANVLYNQGAKGIDDWTNKVNDQGYAAETAAIKMDNLKGDIEQLGGALETAFIGAGSGSQGGLRKLTQGATDAVNVFNKMPGPLQSTATGMLAITAVLGGGLWFTSRVIRNVSATRAALAEMNITLRDSEGNLTRTGVAFKRLAIGGAVIAGLAALDGALSSIDHHNIGPTVNELANALNALASGRNADVGSDLADLAGSLDLVESKSSGAVAGVEKVLGPLTKLSESISGKLGFSDRSQATQIEDATAQLQTLDQALSGLVSSGSADRARDAFDALATSQGLSADEQERLMKQLPGYRDALAEATGQTTVTAGATAELGAQSKLSAAEQAKLAESLEKARKAARGEASAFTEFGDSLDDGKVSLKGWINDMEKSARALANFTANARRAAKRGLAEGLIAELEAAGPAGALRMKQLANATDTEIDRANRAWRKGQAAIRDYVAMKVPPKTVDVNTNPALNAVAQLQRAIDNMRGKEISITLVQGQRQLREEGRGHAMGGPIVGRGTATSDSIPAYLSNGEWVMRAAAVAKYGPRFMADVNAMRFAQGGLAERHSARSYQTTNHNYYGASNPFPSQLTLSVDGQQFTAYVTSVASAVAEARANRVSTMRR